MVQHLVDKLGLEASSAAPAPAAHEVTAVPVRGVRDALADAQLQIATMRAAHCELAAELAALRARAAGGGGVTTVDSDEGVPPARS